MIRKAGMVLGLMIMFMGTSLFPSPPEAIKTVVIMRAIGPPRTLEKGYGIPLAEVPPVPIHSCTYSLDAVVTY
jgi:hypothetical protein